MLPKSVYNKLSSSDKAKVKANLSKKGVGGSGAYIFGKDKPFGHYGEKIGKYSGIPFGRPIGAIAGHLIGKAFGSGAYINSRGKYIPSYKGTHKMMQTKGVGAYYDMPKNITTNATSPPSFGSNRTVIRHREFIGNIQGSTNFEINVWNVNPGDIATFPWLANIAANYEKYRPIGIIFEFKSTSASALNSTNTALGTVMMCPRYNAVSQSVPGSKMEMLQIENCVSVCPAESAMCGIECAKNYNPLGVLYNRTGGSIPAGSEQLYDFADFYLATEGMQAVATIGELWVTYEIELLTPILGGGQIGNDVLYTHYTATSGISTSAYFGSSPLPVLQSTFFLTLGTNTITFPENIIDGKYLILYRVVGGAAAIGSSITATATTNCAAVFVYNNNTSNTLCSGYGAANTIVGQSFIISITGANAVVTFSSGALPTSPTWMDLIVTQIPDDAI